MTSATPMAVPLPCRREKQPAGRPTLASAARTARPSISQVPGCAGWALTTTGQPAASAQIVSVPTTEMAKGKLLAPKTTMGPMGSITRRTSGLGRGWRSGMAWSILASAHEPSRIRLAKSLHCPTARPRSPVQRANPFYEQRAKCETAIHFCPGLWYSGEMEKQLVRIMNSGRRWVIYITGVM